jgi:regulator of cell morphogenesis and NO signaling
VGNIQLAQATLWWRTPMNFDATQTVREVALSIPAATRVFERLGIDYCCGGNKSLREACNQANLPIEQVLQSLQSAASAQSREENAARQGQSADWRSAPVTDLIAHIKHTHHKYVREEIARLAPLFEKVCGVHGDRHVELCEIYREFRALSQELATHMIKEEMVLFPYIERMEEAVVAGDPILPAPFGTVHNPVGQMVHEHDSAGRSLVRVRTFSQAYTPPADACVSYRTLYSALAEFERDLHQHIHLENNILFPRAIEMERGK